MEDKNQEQSMPSEPYDMRQYVEFEQTISVAMWNNCPTVEWCSWKYVLKNVKKAVMDLLLVRVDEVDGGGVEGRLQVVVL
ncbi:hypothetical protein D8674_003933 [Pyrus ussuriensis x Pyrus communis]|uniref:Uncharacterized protein n=1 Tax=Pyrus ussuriensis x Pyrus communis TaxID=2448454 RepID=A0A5N5FIF1_9ROSA|nr:hypothetical protein D8674_003933 [Pyrus ussuriensis x Pyrus communis]